MDNRNEITERLVSELEEWMVNGMTDTQKKTIDYLIKVDKDGRRLRAYVALEIGYAKARKKGESK